MSEPAPERPVRDHDRAGSASPTLDPTRFRQLMSRVPTSVAVVTAMLTAETGEAEPVGMVIGTLTSVSLEPPLVGFFADEHSRTRRQLVSAGRVAFNLLTRDSSDITRAFARPVGGGRFDGVSWSTTAAGTPYLDDALLVIEGDIVSTTPTGDHQLVLVEVWTALAQRDVGGPMVFYAGELMGLQHDQDRQPVWQLGRYERR